MELRFQTRVALYNTIAAGIIIAIAYAGLYLAAYTKANDHLNDDLMKEKSLLFGQLRFKGDSVLTNIPPAGYANIESHANPVLILLTNEMGKTVYRSPSVPESYVVKDSKGMFSNIIIGKEHFRQSIFPLINNEGKKKGFAVIAISREESWAVLTSLLTVLYLSYPIVIVAVYFFLLLSLAKAIAPIRKLIKAASDINDANISMRLPLPKQQDDIYQLTATINELLGRLEKSVNNQKQFTADASHEMRNPLSAIRLILEVLTLRKRDPEHYERGIKNAIAQIDKLSQLLEQLLQLARLRAGAVAIKPGVIKLRELAITLKNKWKDRLEEKEINFTIDIPGDREILSHFAFLEVVLENLLGNAIKYGRVGGHVCMRWNEQENSLLISDNGIGIAAEHLPHLFERFYRTDHSHNSGSPGYGVGLALVDKIGHLLNIDISVSSTLDVGTCFTLRFAPEVF